VHAGSEELKGNLIAGERGEVSEPLDVGLGAVGVEEESEAAPEGGWREFDALECACELEPALFCDEGGGDGILHGVAGDASFDGIGKFGAKQVAPDHHGGGRSAKAQADDVPVNEVAGKERHRGLLDAVDGFACELDEVVDGGAAGQQGELGDESTLDRLAVRNQLGDLVGVGAAIEVGGEAREVLEGEGDESGSDAALQGGERDRLERFNAVTQL
jgi:hypothetical protein